MQTEKRDAREKKDAIEIDMNPMVDLAFLLLTFFMLTTTFAKPQAMELVMPAKPKAEDLVKEQPLKESKALTIVLDTLDKMIWYRGITDAIPTRVKLSSKIIKQVVGEQLSSTPDLVILIKPKDNCRYENIVDILDEMTQLEVPRYTLAQVEDYDRAVLKKLK